MRKQITKTEKGIKIQFHPKDAESTVQSILDKFLVDKHFLTDKETQTLLVFIAQKLSLKEG